jgi:hypothetical protein
VLRTALLLLQIATVPSALRCMPACGGCALGRRGWVSQSQRSLSCGMSSDA